MVTGGNSIQSERLVVPGTVYRLAPKERSILWWNPSERHHGNLSFRGAILKQMITIPFARRKNPGKWSTIASWRES